MGGSSRYDPRMNSTADTITNNGREPLVLVHGIGSSSRCWELIVPLLEDRYEILNVDLPGHYLGPLVPKGVRPNVKAMADGVEAALDAAGWDSAHVVGNSLGGWIALEMGARGRARSVTALAPGGGWTRLSPAELRLLPFFVFQRVMARIGMPIRHWLMKSPARRRLAFKEVMERADKITPELAVHMQEAFVRCGVFWRIVFTDAISKMMRSAPIACPVAIVWGNKDAVLPLRICADRWQRELPGAKWHLWMGVGHMPMVDEPEKTVAVIDETVASAKHELIAAA